MNRIMRNGGWVASLKDISCRYINSCKSIQRYSLRASPTVDIKYIAIGDKISSKYNSEFTRSLMYKAELDCYRRVSNLADTEIPNLRIISEYGNLNSYYEENFY